MIYEDLERFKENLLKQERSARTITQYSNYITDFIEYSQIKEKSDINKDKLIEYKEHLSKKHKGNINSINIKTLILNKFITFLDLPDTLKLKQEKQQKQTTLENVLTEKEYNHLRDYAKNNKQERLYYLMGTLEGTGIRISELKFITYEAVKKQEAVIVNKGKTRKIPIQNKVKKELLKYCKENNIKSGIIFKSKNGNPLDSAYIWKQLQKLARTSKKRTKEKQGTPT